MTNSERNQQNFIDGCYSGARSIAYYAGRTRLSHKGEVMPDRRERVKEQYETFMQVLEGSRELQIEMCLLIMGDASSGDVRWREFLSRAAEQYDQTNPVEEEEEEHQS